MPLDKIAKNIIKKALKEDIGKKDITSLLSIPRQARGRARIIAKDKGVLCGFAIAREVFRQLDKKLKFKAFKKEGQTFLPGETIAVLNGNLQVIMAAERVALNFLSLFSGVASLTRKFVEKASGTKSKIMETRKTTPNLRDLEKYAVRIGGGINHRRNLAQAILIKDNHLLASGCINKGRINEERIKELILRAKKTRLKVEVEADSLKLFKKVIKYKPDIIMLDNFSLKDIKTAVALRNRNSAGIKLEASGGINLKKVRPIARAGVDFISAGALTHSPCAIDFSLELIRQ